jgi:hypothetical protein
MVGRSQIRFMRSVTDVCFCNVIGDDRFVSNEFQKVVQIIRYYCFMNFRQVACTKFNLGLTLNIGVC